MLKVHITDLLLIDAFTSVNVDGGTFELDWDEDYDRISPISKEADEYIDGLAKQMADAMKEAVAAYIIKKEEDILREERDEARLEAKLSNEEAKRY